jgi:hypothetical protein
MDVIVTVDTEADDQWDRGKPDLTTANLAAVPRFQELCDRHGMKPTYLCTWEVVEDERFASLREYQHHGRAEVGAHLHPWTTPPLDDAEGGFERRTFGMYPSELEPAAFEAKLRALTERIGERAGVAPTSYRAGRWGFRGEHVPVLLSLGYVVDCSVTPLKSWEQTVGLAAGGPDYRAAPPHPYFLDPDDVCREGSSALLEVPMTILYPRRAMARSARLRRLHERYRRTLAGRVLNKLFRADMAWFRPYPHMSAADLVGVYRRARKTGLPAVEMMFHSSELMAGGSPYNRDEASVEHLFAKLETVFAKLAADGCRGATLSQFARDFSATPRPR